MLEKGFHREILEGRPKRMQMKFLMEILRAVKSRTKQRKKSKFANFIVEFCYFEVPRGAVE